MAAPISPIPTIPTTVLSGIAGSRIHPSLSPFQICCSPLYRMSERVRASPQKRGGPYSAKISYGAAHAGGKPYFGVGG
jgi:hypothetical protein